jgi:hypothetical protein
MLRLDPWVPHGKVWLDPVLPPGTERLAVHNIPLAGARVSVVVEDGSLTVEGLPATVELVSAPRHPLTAS